MSEFTMTIDGKAVAAEDSFGVINPATEEVFAECPECSPAQLNSAMEAAERAFQSWREVNVAKRKQVLLDCAAALEPHVEELAELLTREQGRVRSDTLREMHGAVQWFGGTAGLEIPSDVLQDDEEARVELRRKPFGVVGAIVPWNFPIVLFVSKVAPALLTGNTLVVKPSPYTPLSTLKLGEILRDVVPPGVLNIVSGDDELGAAIVRHPAVRKISFTGSVEVGKDVAQATALDLKRFVLELGGNDPAIVLPDADPSKVAEALFWGAFFACGQICMAIKRLYVHETLYDALVERLAGIARNIPLGDGLDPASVLGPINNKAQLERVIELVEDARQAGANIVTGGQRLDRPGYFYPPTIVTGISDGTRLVDEEQFGPALPVIPYRDLDDALKRANATNYGLGGSIWTNNPEQGAELASRLECGTVWVNKHITFSPFHPFGGMKQSGIGRQNGVLGLEELTEPQVVYVAKG